METVRRLLVEEGLHVTLRDANERKDIWAGAGAAEAVLVDECLEPAEVAEALDRGWVAGTAPLFVLARRLPDRDRYAAWLQSGAWDIVKIPLESVALALRLLNILGAHRSERTRMKPGPRYSLQSLSQAAEEALALARRYDRPLHCVAVGVDWPNLADADIEPLMERLADATQRLTRRSDLLGVGDLRTLLILLPDTNEAGAGVFVDRLGETLQERLGEWGVAAALRTEVVSPTGLESGRELLETAIQKVGRTAP
jgi:nucleotide-binding universal stress UspA family protein